MTRRWKFEAYQKEQRAVTKLATSQLGGLSAADTIIVWGNGGFGPTSHGHASAPNKKMQAQLARHVAIVVGSEYRSSKTSSCHHAEISAFPSHDGKRHTVVACRACHTMLGRDINAAHVILDIFLSMQSTSDLPDWIRDDDVRAGNNSTTLVPLS